MAFAVTNDFTAGTNAVASEVNQNFTDVETELNAFPTNGTLSDGAVSTTAKLANSIITSAKFAAAALVTEAEGLDSSDNDTSFPTTAATKDYIDNLGSHTPATYTGIAAGSGTDSQGSVTLPNGMIIKFGQVTTAASIPNFSVEGTVTFNTAFPSACELALYNTGNVYNGGSTVNNVITALAVGTFKYKHGSNPKPTVIYWTAFGY